MHDFFPLIQDHDKDSDEDDEDEDDPQSGNRQVGQSFTFGGVRCALLVETLLSVLVSVSIVACYLRLYSRQAFTVHTVNKIYNNMGKLGTIQTSQTMMCQ